jgi:phosphopentomutase
VHLARPFPTYPDGFPPHLVRGFAERTGRPVIANVVGSGTDVMQRFGAEHERTGAWILYTSADSVFQVAAHEAVVPLGELYAACETARAMLVAPHDVSRVIARPFVGGAGAYRARATVATTRSPRRPRRCSTRSPPRGWRARASARWTTCSPGRALSARHTAGNAEGIAGVEAWLRGSADGLLFANLVDFDTLYGHRNDPAGFAAALRAFDAALPALLAALREDDLLFITADHGNDPTTASTDHARERVPLLACGRAVRPGPLGERATFADLGATVAEWLGVEFRGAGRSFLGELTARAAAPAAGAGA